MQPTHRARASSVLGVLTLALTLVSSAVHADPPFPDPAPQRPFAANSVWNTTVPVNATLAPNSAALVDDLIQKVDADGSWIDSNSYSLPVYSVPADEPRVSVQVDTPSSMFTNLQDAGGLSRQLAAVPIPPGAHPAGGSDHHMIIWQPSTDTAWEMWLVRSVLTVGGLQWHAAWGARLDHVSSASGISPYPYGASASGLSVLGGLITAQELRSRVIPHALAMAIPAPAAGRFVWPANRTDGTSLSPTAIPEGTHMRLDPRLNVAALGLSPLGTAIAVAAQRYGVIVRDRAGTVSFYAEDPTSVGMLSYDWGGELNAARVMAGFPWSHFQVLSPSAPGATGDTLGSATGGTTMRRRSRSATHRGCHAGRPSASHAAGRCRVRRPR